MHKTTIITILSISLFCSGCDRQLKREISEYQGDGTIRYLKAPNFLGVSGFSIQMSPFDLSTPVNIRYDLSGLPLGRSVVYLVVEDPCPLEKIERGTCAFEFSRNGKLVKKLSSDLLKITNNMVGKKNRFYFFAYNDEQNASSIISQDTSSLWSLSVSCKNPYLNEPVKAYILIERGGYK